MPSNDEIKGLFLQTLLRVWTLMIWWVKLSEPLKGGILIAILFGIALLFYAIFLLRKFGRLRKHRSAKENFTSVVNDISELVD